MSREICGAIMTIDGGVENEEMVLETAKRIADLLKQMTPWDVKIEEWFTGRDIEDEGYHEYDCDVCNSTFVDKPVWGKKRKMIEGVNERAAVVKCPNCGTWKETR